MENNWDSSFGNVNSMAGLHYRVVSGSDIVTLQRF